MFGKAAVVGVGHCVFLVCRAFRRPSSFTVRFKSHIRRPYWAVQPPSTEKLAPVICAASCAAQEQRKRSHLLDRDELLRRLGREQDVVDHLIPAHVARRHRVRDLLLHQWRPDVAGADAVAGDLRPGELQRHRLGETHDAVLGRDVGRLEGGSDQRMRRGRGDDTAPAAPLHAGHGCTDRVEGGGQVDRNDRIPLVDRKLLDWGDVLDAGIVDEDIHAAEGLLPEPDQFGDFRSAWPCRGRIDGLHPEIALDCRSLLLDIGRCTHSVEHDVGTCTCEGTRIRETDAARRAGHDCDFTFQNTHCVFPC